MAELTAKVWAALPGSMAALVARTGLTPDQCYSVFLRLRKEHKLRTEKVPLSCVIYHRAHEDS